MTRIALLAGHAAHGLDAGTEKRAGWWDQAKCRGESWALFYPASGDNKAIGEAKAICGRCHVRDECLQAALATGPADDWGVWGGTTRNDRRRIRRGQPPRHITVDGKTCIARRHDTPWAYRDAHCRCPDAINSWREYNHERAAEHRRRYAVRTGLPRGPRPLSGYDPHKVDMACDGRPVMLSVPEMRAAVARLISWGLTSRQIALRLHCNPRTVDRYRAQLRRRRARAGQEAA